MLRLLPTVLASGALLLGACSGDPAVRVDNGPRDGGGDVRPEEGEGTGPGENGVEGDPGSPGDPNSPGDSGEPGELETSGTAGRPGVPMVEDLPPLPPGSRAGAYVGRLGEGSGVFVLDRSERLIGLAMRDDGSGMSWFADFGAGTASGPALRYEHAMPDVATGAVAATSRVLSPLGERVAGAALGDGPELGLIDGERIESVADGTVVDLDASGRAGLAMVSRDTLTGSWQGEHLDCDSLGEHCTRSVMSIEIFNNAFEGSSGVFTSDGTDLFPAEMVGTLVPLGDFAETVFEWNTYDYTGIAHFVPGDSDRLVLIGRTDRELADYPVIATVLTRTPTL